MGLLSSIVQWTGRKFADLATISSSQIGQLDALGPYGHLRDMFTPRQVNPYLLEALREAVAPIDGGIGRLVTLDGIVAVEGDNDRLVAEIEDWASSVQVGDAEIGLQAFCDALGNEVYEQGFAIGEWVPDRRGRDIIALRVADSKGVHFRGREGFEAWYQPPPPVNAPRGDGTHQVEAVLRNSYLTGLSTQALGQAGYTQLDTQRLVYIGNRLEGSDPYGVSMIRSLEFVSQILLQIQNATGQVWGRFGDPPLSLTYKTKGRALTQDQLAARRNALAADLAKVMAAKGRGNSADFVQAIGADDDIAITVIGAQEQILEIEMPARHMLEQVVAKFGLPAWMLGFQWSTSERLAEQQSEVVLQESRTRWVRRKPYLTNVVATMLRLRGRTWRRGDWALVQRLPNLHDELKRAQAGFLLAQTDLMLRGELNATPQAQGTDSGAAKALTWPAAPLQLGKSAAGGAEPFAEADPALPEIEEDAIDGLLAAWSRARRRTLAALGLEESSKAADTFRFQFSMLATLAEIETELLASISGEDGPLVRNMLRAWLRGVRNAAQDVDVAASLAEVPATLRAEIIERGFGLVRDATVRTLRDDIAGELAQGVYDGLNSTEVARRLRARFSAHEYDWERLARSEITLAQAQGKEAEYRELGVTRYDYVTMGDSRVSAICRRHASNGPHTVGQGPLPMRDSHPNCRCTTRPRLED